MKALLLLSLFSALPAQAAVVNLIIGQSASCDNLPRGSVIIISDGRRQSAVTCNVGSLAPRKYWTCYSTLYATTNEMIAGDGGTKREAMANAIFNCKARLRQLPFGACASDEIVIGPTCEEREE